MYPAATEMKIITTAQLCFTLFLELKNIISDKQFGFKKGLNTKSALLQLMTKVYSPIKNIQLTYGLFLDFSKAFDQ